MIELRIQIQLNKFNELNVKEFKFENRIEFIFI